MKRLPCSISSVAVLIAAGFFATPAALAETWSDNTGKFQVEAEFVDIDGTSVILRKANGATLTVPLTRLSAESRALAEKLDQPFPVPPIPLPNAELTLKTPVAPSVAPMPAFPDDASLQATFEFCRSQILAGHPEVFWHALPRDIREMFDRQDLRNDIVAPLKAQEPAINASQALLKQVAAILTKQKQFILDSEMLTNLAPPETLPIVGQGYDPAVGLSYEVGMLLLSMNTLESQTVTELLNERGPRLGVHLKAILSLVPPEMIEATLSRTEIAQQDDKTGVMRLQREDGTTQTIEMVRYVDRWVPKNLADNWLANKESIEAEIKSNIKSLPETPAAKEAIASLAEGITFVKTAIAPLSDSTTQQEFDQALKNLTVAVGTPSDWLMMAINSGNAKMYYSQTPGGLDFFVADAPFNDDDTPPKTTAVSLKEFNAMWKYTSSGESKPAGELLIELAGPLGLKFAPPLAFSESLSQPVTVASDVPSRLAAIEQVCRDINCKPIYRDTELKIEQGIREIPATPVGPFLALLSSFKTEPDSATGQISLDLVSAGLLPVMAHQVAETLKFSLDDAVSEDDTSLFWKSMSQQQAMLENIAAQSDDKFFALPFSRADGPDDAVAHQIFSQRSLQLKGLLRNITEVKAINGSVNLSLTTKVVSLKFDDVAEGMEQTDGNIKARITEVLGQTSSKKRVVQIEVQWPEEDPDQVNRNGFRKSKEIEVFAQDADGKSVGINGQGSFGRDNTKTISLSLEAIPASLEVMISLGTEALTYPVTIRNISVPNHEQMPERLKELSFEGDQPVTLKFKQISGSGNLRDLEVTLTNKSNKTLTNLTVLCNYLDADGKAPPVEETRFGSTQTSFTSDVTCTLGPGMTREIEIGAFDIPEATESASLALKHVGFSDATLWDASEE